MLKKSLPISEQEVQLYFNQDYKSARSGFLETCGRLGVPVTTHFHPLSSGDAELATDVAVLGPANATRRLVLISGTHGLEGVTGSGIQVGWLQRKSKEIPDDVAVILIHMLNPWGAANLRRQNEDNVDLNRNFVDFSRPLPDSEFSEKLHRIISVPDVFVGNERSGRVEREIAEFRKEHGESAFFAAMYAGQYQIPDGAGFGGQSATWSNALMHHILSTQVSGAKSVAVIDIHTGLGPFAYGMLIDASPADSSELRRSREWFGEELVALQETHDIPYVMRGGINNAIVQALPEASVVMVTLEYGTHNQEKLVQLQIDDRWLWFHGDRQSPVGRDIQRRLGEFFYPATPEWLTAVYDRGEEVISRSLSNLSRRNDALGNMSSK